MQDVRLLVCICIAELKSLCTAGGGDARCDAFADPPSPLLPLTSGSPC